MDSTDADLLHRLRRGHESAYHEMVDRYGTRLYRLAFSLVGNGADAAEVLQETFTGAVQHVQKFEERSSIKTWLSRILVRQAARCHRSRARHKTVSLDGIAESAGVPKRTGASVSAQAQLDIRMDLLAALDVLSPIHRDVIVLREMQQMTYDEIADVLNVPRGTVESRLFRARRMLRERLKDYVPQE